MASLMEYVREVMADMEARMRRAAHEAGELLREESGQGTTEYAILVGVHVWEG